MKASKEQVRFPAGQSFRVLRWERNLREVRTVTGPGRTEAAVGEGAHWHFHKEMELTLFTRGEGTRFVGDSMGFFTPGDLVLLGENLPHHWHVRGDCGGVSVQWHFPVGHPFWAFPENLALADLMRQSRRGLLLTGKSAGIVSGILTEMSAREGHGRLAGLLGALSVIASAPPTELRALSTRPFLPTAEDRHQAAISRAVQHLIAHFRDDVRLEDVMEAAGMSRATFARQFKALTGHTFSGFLIRLRLQAARRELRETKRPVVDIAFASGFNQLSFFNRVFRRELKCSPSAYRARRGG
jgi:AraC-like DNA-binding protein